MPIVKDDTTGEEVEVVPAHAVAAISITTSMNGDMPENMSNIIEQAMSGAAAAAMEDGVTDPNEIKAAMLKARDSVKAAMRQRQES